ncbi:cell division protein FtsZ [Mergibacter septicus]|uniref:Cell division protein FtsZ n=1 Tax=Mergibacter septicus TaxID=221402 RepID=A0A8E3MHX1_9PAST|nr:cell division protein FtsZ [Mergibacter septicus]AWX16280.1 cell division protein FtsZ [Mergibacter septicus]QDJ15532.1 cell division protein FtsZ [Mergibacter septicus]UTU48898.1 cell division protein FtsZ [Mergibacter septicus]WMR96801.1 cell division protein FtsZ [Mergibacter septicus]
MFEPVEYDIMPDAVIKVIGVGGGGGNAINHMIESEIEGVDFFSVNTDAQALRKNKAQNTIQIGRETTKGLGAGANPNVGRAAAEADQDQLRTMLEGADMVFIASGMGGGTGTGAAPVVAQIAKELGILTVAVVTKPFGFEGKKRMMLAEQGIAALSKHVDSLIIIPNEKLSKALGNKISLLQAFAIANDILKNAVRGISDMITSPGMINVDFADVKTVMSEMGYAMMGTGVAKGEVGSGRAEKAAQEAIASPLLEDIDLSGAKGVLVNITANEDFTLDELECVGNTVKQFASEEATVVVGTSLDTELGDEIRVTIVATGIGTKESKEQIKIMPKMSDASAITKTAVFSQQENSGYSVSGLSAMTVGNTAKKASLEEEIFDIREIPTFMRNQAD